jgi:predicted GNAT family N-acyltransferase
VTRIALIGPNHPLYPQEVDLRERVLLEPIGYTMAKFAADFPFEDRFEHFVAVIEHPKGKRVVGCVCLLPNHPEPGVGKLMQMAVDPQRQGEGIGRELVAHLERRAFGELGLRELYCHSREDACGFYRQMGWTIAGERFMEAGVPHFKMVFKPDEA